MRRLLIFAAAFAAAAAFSVLTMPSALPVLAAAVLAAGISLLPPLRRERRLRALRICLLGVSVGLAWCAGYRALALGSAARYDRPESCRRGGRFLPAAPRCSPAAHRRQRRPPEYGLR